jgi:hypothetical protein
VNDEEVRRAFPDGIFWLILGQTVEPLRLQSEPVRYVTGVPKALCDHGRSARSAAAVVRGQVVPSRPR